VKKDHIFAEFKSVADMRLKAALTLPRLRGLLDQRRARAAVDPDVSTSGANPAVTSPSEIPAPPDFYAKPKFIAKSHFFGRKRELGWLDEWAAASEPVLIFEAIGGMGKSMLTWECAQEEAAKPPGDWAGILWYSFYERGATMNDFCVTTLAYITACTPEELQGRGTDDLARELVQQFQLRRWLILLDGIERVLVAYHRFDAAQAADDDVDRDPDAAGRPGEDCVRTADQRLLEELCGAAPSKFVMSSRLMPNALHGIGGQPRPGVRHRKLTGLAPEDAERLVRDIGVRGSSMRMQHFLEGQFGCHPLVVAVIAGLVHDFPPAPRDFDRWIDDPEGGANVNLASADIKQRQNHILKSAFDALDGDAREVITRLAMCAHALDWETMLALNPRRPAPPGAVAEPREPERWDYGTFNLEFQIRTAKAKARKTSLEKQLRAHRERLEAEYQAAQQKYAEYQVALMTWRRSRDYRAADTWLHKLPADLERRGLLQWDRDAKLFDLHPVIRHFAVYSTSPERREQTGQIVADYFASRPPPAYETAATLADLDIGFQIVRALNLAGRAAAAWRSFRTDLGSALSRLELHHETLALLRPLFPDGWGEPPVGIDDADAAADEASIALSALRRQKEAYAQSAFALQKSVDDGITSSLASRLRNHALDLSSCVRRERLFSLSRDVAAVEEDEEQVFWANIDLIYDLVNRGEVSVAREFYDRIRSEDFAEFTNGCRARALSVEAELLYREGQLDEDWLERAIRDTERLREPFNVRWMWQLCGRYRASVGRYNEATAAYETDIERARQVQLSAPDTEAEYAISLHHLGRAEEAFAAARRAETGPGVPLSVLAEFYLLAGDRKKAAKCVHDIYPVCWSDGPPYAWHWALRRCREVLWALGEPEPEMPPYDPANIKEELVEAKIRRLLAEHEAEKKKAEA
jgi:hypothetical protein